MDSPFIYRWNADRTIDAICTVCYQTACRETTLTLVRAGEVKHECGGPPIDLPSVSRPESSSVKRAVDVIEQPKSGL